MSKVLVTGANGFLATNVIIELLAGNYSVIGLLRDIKSFQYNKHPNVELVEGDISKLESYENILKSCSTVIHIAAITAQNLPRYNQYKKVNVEATRQILEQAVKFGVQKFIYVSTANTLGYGTKNNPGNEENPIKYPFTKSYYALSKLNAEQIVLSYQDKLDVIVVNPTFMLGSYDSKPSSGKIILMGYKKKIIFYPPGGKNFVHVYDVALGIIKALEIAKNAEIFLLANENLSYLDFYRKLSSKTDSKPIFIQLPKLVLFFLGMIGELLRVFHFKTNLSLANMHALCINNYFNNEKAKEQLGIRFHSIEKSIEDALYWFSQQKMLK